MNSGGLVDSSSADSSPLERFVVIQEMPLGIFPLKSLQIIPDVIEQAKTQSLLSKFTKNFEKLTL